MALLEPTGKGNYIRYFTEYVKKLIEMQVDDFLLLEKVDKPVQCEFSDSEKIAAGDKPDTAGVNQGVGSEAVWPKGGGAQIRVLSAVVSILVECEELTLQGMITQCVRNEQRKKDRQCCRRGAVSKGFDLVR